MAYDSAGPDGDDENRTNGEEGLGPEVGFYFTYWVEAYELPETEAPTTLVFQRRTDWNVYLDGRINPLLRTTT